MSDIYEQMAQNVETLNAIRRSLIDANVIIRHEDIDILRRIYCRDYATTDWGAMMYERDD